MTNFITILCVNRADINPRIEAYIQTKVLKKTLEIISPDYRRGLQEGGTGMEASEVLVEKLNGTEEVQAGDDPLHK